MRRLIVMLTALALGVGGIAGSAVSAPIRESNVSQCPCGGPYGLPDCTLQLNDYLAYIHNGTGIIVEEECFFFGGGWVTVGYTH